LFDQPAVAAAEFFGPGKTDPALGSYFFQPGAEEVFLAQLLGRQIFSNEASYFLSK